jgi:NAD(P)-dependent dehydrogenase (short-subunit alcohol dehydrogenase family)
MIRVLITGATRGLGLAAARAAATRPGVEVLVAGRDPVRVREVATEVHGTPIDLDLTSLGSVRAAAQAIGAIDAVALNAGIQDGPARRMTGDGFEESFQVNHLAQLVLLDLLLAASPPPARIVTLGSGTHDPAQRSGLPAPIEGTMDEIAAGGPDGRTAGLRRYATTKLLTTATALGLARERPDLYVVCLDPGLMGGTGLVRAQPAPVRVIAQAMITLLRPFPFSSTTQRSGEALARLLLEVPPPVAGGTVADFRLRPAQVSARATDPQFQDELLAYTRAVAAAAV